MFINCALDTVDADPADEVFSPGWSFALKIHDASWANDHIDSWADRTTGHARSFMHSDVLAELLPVHESADSLKQRRAIVCS